MIKFEYRINGNKIDSDEYEYEYDSDGILVELNPKRKFRMPRKNKKIAKQMGIYNKIYRFFKYGILG